MASEDGCQRPHKREGVVTVAQPTSDGAPADGTVGNTMGKEGVTVLLAEVFSSLRQQDRHMLQ